MQNPNLPHPETKQKGYTIIELGIALAIIAVLIVAGLAGVTTVLNNSKSNGQIEESGIVLAKLQSLLTSTSASGINTAGAVGAGFFPAARVSGTTTNATVANKFGGSEFVRTNAAELILTTHGVAAAAGVGAIYTITGVPKAVCANIASSLATLANAAWIHSVATNESDSGGVGSFTVGTSQIKAPGGQVQGARVGTQCNLADTVNLAFFLRP
jgi:prepilin-type N-terminal cleavage/methylation domain-containing protein